MYFTTKDSDNDKWSSGNCGLVHGIKRPAGGWWNDHCWLVGPNNFYNHYDGIKLNGKWHTLPFIEMKIRPQNCNI